MPTYNIPPEDVTEKLWCVACLRPFPSDEEICIDHVVDDHGVIFGTMVREISRLYFTDFEGILLSDLESNYPLFGREGSVDE